MVCLVRRNQIWIALLSRCRSPKWRPPCSCPEATALTITSDLIQGTATAGRDRGVPSQYSASPSTTSHTRLFWILMSAGMVFWLTYQTMWNYFEVIKRQDVPDPFLGDIVLFLHLVPMIAALAVLPHLREDERDERIRMLDFTLLLTWWVFVYVYLVIPWQTVRVDEATYSANFNFAYLTEKIVLLVSLAALAYSARGGWRHLYAQLFGASALYASSSYLRELGHRAQDLLQRQHLRHSLDGLHRLDGRRFPCSPTATICPNYKLVQTNPRNLDHAPQHVRSLHSALGRLAIRTGFERCRPGQRHSASSSACWPWS